MNSKWGDWGSQPKGEGCISQALLQRTGLRVCWGSKKGKMEQNWARAAHSVHPVELKNGSKRNPWDESPLFISLCMFLLM